MALSIGTRLGVYEVDGVLGAGGMGEVYRARDTRLDRHVAIKLLSPALARDRQFRERFAREARVISQLDHPNICPLYDVGEHDGAAFLVMQYLEGETLAARLARGPLPLDEALAISSQILAALEAAHRAGIVHRDLKPGNVILTDARRQPGAYVKLLDFGLAKLVDVPDAETVADTNTALGIAVGTTRYMSPEQARGLAVDARSDLFSFGVVLYEMVSGRAAFDAPTTTDVIVAILEREPAPLSRYRQDVPPSVQQVVSRCLEKEALRRYQSTSAIAGDLARGAGEGSGQRGAAKAAPSIAVLPFVNMSTDAENEYFCDGIAEDLIGALTRIEALRVAARTSAFSFKGKQADLKDVGRALNVGTVLEGSVRKAGSRLRVTAQLVNVADGYQLWSERYDRQLEDVFAIQDEISAAIVKALKVKLLGEEAVPPVRRHTDNLEAYQLYLKGRHHWHRWNAAEFAKSQECMERALALDPDYALAYFGLADVYLASGAIGLIAYRDLLPKAKDALTRALALDPDLAEAWALMGVVHFYDWDWAASERAATRAIELSPGLGHAYLVRSLNYYYWGQTQHSLADARRALDLDPLAPMWHYALAMAHLADRDHANARQQAEAALDIDARFWWGSYALGVLDVARGAPGEAVRHFTDAVTHSGGAPYAIGLRACALALAGDRDSARQEVERLYAAAAAARHVPAISLAVAHAGLGELDEAFACLDRSYDETDIWLIGEVKYLSQLDALRADARMADLRRRLSARGVRIDP